MTKKKTYTVGEFAKELGVHPETVRRWEAKGRIPTAKRFRDEEGPRIFSEADLKAAKKYRDRMIDPPSKRQRSINFQRS